MKIISLVAAAGAAALALVGPAAAGTATLIATDGPGYTITLNKTVVTPGTYKIVVHDRARTHNFHLIGPGVNKKTDLNWVGTVTWTVKLKKGTYKYVCDPHVSLMHGSLKVG